MLKKRVFNFSKFFVIGICIIGITLVGLLFKPANANANVMLGDNTSSSNGDSTYTCDENVRATLEIKDGKVVSSRKDTTVYKDGKEYVKNLKLVDREWGFWDDLKLCVAWDVDTDHFFSTTEETYEIVFEYQKGDEKGEKTITFDDSCWQDGHHEEVVFTGDPSTLENWDWSHLNEFDSGIIYIKTVTVSD